MKIGVTRRKITPPLGVSMAGFADPDRKASSILDDLFLTAMVLEQDAKRAVIICADLISFTGPAVKGKNRTDSSGRVKR